MTTVSELVPGQIVTNPGGRAVFVASADHPVYLTLRLVVWRMEDLSWCHDALDAHQEVGEADHPSDEERIRRLRPKPGDGLAGAAFDVPS